MKKSDLIAFRKNYFDSILLFITPVSFLIYTSFPSVSAFLFAITGMSLVFIRHNVAQRYFDSIFLFSMLLALYMLFHVAYGAAKLGNLRDVNGQFPIYMVLITPITVGLVLVKNPLIPLIWGSRLAVTIAIIISILFFLFSDLERAHFGTNPLIAAYILLLFSCLSRFRPSSDEPIFFGLALFYLGSIIGVATGSRIIVLFYIVAIFADCIYFIFKRGFSWQLRTRTALGLLGCVLIGSLFILNIGDNLRATSWLGVSYSDLLKTDNSIWLRFGMWKYGWQLFTAHPIIGAGASNVLQEMKFHVFGLENTPFTARHLHNLFFHEIAVHGTVGFILVFGLHFLIFRRAYTIWARNSNGWNLILLFFAIIIYGLTGSHLTDERMVIVTAFIFAVLIKKPVNEIK